MIWLFVLGSYCAVSVTAAAAFSLLFIGSRLRD
jgi:hypothetical protein